MGKTADSRIGRRMRDRDSLIGSSPRAARRAGIRLHAPVFGAGGGVAHRRGVTESPGLYFLGLPWQHTRGSALLGWVKDDADYVSQEIARRIATRGASPGIVAAS